jgi:hypothetical protein
MLYVARLGYFLANSNLFYDCPTSLCPGGSSAQNFTNSIDFQTKGLRYLCLAQLHTSRSQSYDRELQRQR